MKFRPHTVIVLVGPTMSGKSFFTEHYLAPHLRNDLRTAGLEPNIQVVSSDDCRREVLGDMSAHKYDPRMMHVSEKAFKLLHERIDAATAWPHPAHFVIVDSTGLNEGFRKRVAEQARATAYQVAVVVFDYKRRSDYEQHVAEADLDRRLQAKHIDRLRNGTYRTLKVFDSVERVRSKDFSAVQVEVVGAAEYARARLDPTLTWDIVGDVHGCREELIALLEGSGYKWYGGRLVPPEGHGLILNGDLIDKGPHSRAMLEFAHEHRNESWFRITQANHENFVARHLLGQVKEPSHDVMEHFDSATAWANDEEAKRILLEVREASSPFWDGGHFVVTHAPCATRYIGKLDHESQRMQRGQFRRPRRGDKPMDEFVKELEASLAHIKNEAIANAPWHIFGHVATNGPFLRKNKVGIDTGCESGGALTMVTIRPRGRPGFRNVPSKQPVTEELPTLWADEEEQEIDFALLDRKEYGRLMWLARNKVNFVSGTMAPADADKERGVLESLDQALLYYKRAGVERVVLQPKYMGSRCNVYLHKDADRCYAVSRNGHVIRKEQVDLAPVFARLRERFATTLADGIMLVLDGELMPWRALGAGLIDEQFKVVGHGARSELDALRAFGFEEVLGSTIAQISPDFTEMPKDEAIRQFGHAKVGTWRNLINRRMWPLAELEDSLLVYEEEVARHGADGPPDFKPFGILKEIWLGGKEVNGQRDGASNEEQFEFVGADDPPAFHMDIDGEWLSARDYFAQICDRGLEGVVVKPAVIRSDVAPALKVRSPRYLTIVYGYDYLLGSKHDRLVRTKGTRNKREASIREFRLGQKMLDVPYAEIGEENEKYLRLAAAMIAEEQREKALDPRL